MLEPWTEEQLHDVYENGVTAFGLLMQIENLQINQSPGWIGLNKEEKRESVDIQGLITETAKKLVSLELRYPEISDPAEDNLYNHLIGNPTRSLIQRLQFYIRGLENSEGIISTDKLVIICAETCVLDFIEKNLDDIKRTELSLQETKERIFSGPDTCSLYLYVSPSNDQKFLDSIEKIYLEYNQTFLEFTKFLSQYPDLFDFKQDSVFSETTIALQDWPIITRLLASPDALEDEEESKAALGRDLANSFVFSFFLFLDEEDFHELYDPRILSYWGDRFWVQDATIPRALVFTPNGINNLAADEKKLKSNASHEYFHFYLNRYFSTGLDPIGSAQYILPKWLVEGLCNVMFLTERGRSDDGFREQQLHKLMSGEEKLLTSSEIMTIDDLNYLHYSVFTHFLLSALNSAIAGRNDIESIPRQSYEITNNVLSVMRNVYRTLEIEYPTAPADIHNRKAIEVINKILQESETFNRYNICSLMKTFDNHRLDFYINYFFPEWRMDEGQKQKARAFLSEMRKLDLSYLASRGDSDGK